MDKKMETKRLENCK